MVNHHRRLSVDVGRRLQKAQALRLDVEAQARIELAHGLEIAQERRAEIAQTRIVVAELRLERRPWDQHVASRVRSFVSSPEVDVHLHRTLGKLYELAEDEGNRSVADFLEEVRTQFDDAFRRGDVFAAGPHRNLFKDREEHRLPALEELVLAFELAVPVKEHGRSRKRDDRVLKSGACAALAAARNFAEAPDQSRQIGSELNNGRAVHDGERRQSRYQQTRRRSVWNAHGRVGTRKRQRHILGCANQMRQIPSGFIHRTRVGKDRLHQCLRHDADIAEQRLRSNPDILDIQSWREILLRQSDLQINLPGEFRQGRLCSVNVDGEFFRHGDLFLSSRAMCRGRSLFVRIGCACVSAFRHRSQT